MCGGVWGGGVVCACRAYRPQSACLFLCSMDQIPGRTPAQGDGRRQPCRPGNLATPPVLVVHCHSRRAIVARQCRPRSSRRLHRGCAFLPGFHRRKWRSAETQSDKDLSVWLAQSSPFFLAKALPVTCSSVVELVRVGSLFSPVACRCREIGESWMAPRSNLVWCPPARRHAVRSTQGVSWPWPLSWPCS